MKGRAFINEKFPVCGSPPTLLLAGNLVRVLTHNILWQMLAQASIRRPTYTTVLFLFWNTQLWRYISVKHFPFGRLAAIHSLKSPCEPACQILPHLAKVFFFSPSLWSIMVSNEFEGLSNKLGKAISFSVHKSWIQGAQFSCRGIPV